MRILLLILISLYSVHSYALDLSSYKEKIRIQLNKYIGESTTNKILGVAEEKSLIQLPEIPEVSLDAKDESFYDVKTSPVFAQGKSYTDLALEAKRSYRISFLQQLFEVTRNSEPKKEDIAKFLNVLEQGGNREGVYRAITLDQVYLSLEQYDQAPSAELVNYIEYFTPKYLRKKYSKENLQSLNLWSLKRLITEKCLELVDVLAEKPETLYNWYAVYSSDIAKLHPAAWSSDTRKNTSDLFHYSWAKSVPFQHIKSEIIIKNHKLMNYLNQLN